MKRLLVSLTCALGIAAAAAGAGIDFTMSPQVGLAYAEAVDPGFSGLALGITPFFQSGALRLEAGLETGLSPLGWQALAPLRAGVGVQIAAFSLEALAEAAPGLALFRPAPLFLFAVGALGRLTWSMGPRFGITGSAGIRWTLCPAYAGYTGTDYSSIDIPFALGVRWTFRSNPIVNGKT